MYVWHEESSTFQTWVEIRPAIYIYIKEENAFPLVGFRPTTVWPQRRHSRLFKTSLSRTGGGKEPFLCFTSNYGIKVGKYFLYSWLVLQPKQSLIMLYSDSRSLHCQSLSIIRIGKQKMREAEVLKMLLGWRFLRSLIHWEKKNPSAISGQTSDPKCLEDRPPEQDTQQVHTQFCPQFCISSYILTFLFKGR